MTVDELIEALARLPNVSGSDLICIAHPDESRGYYPAGDHIFGTVLARNGNEYRAVVLELSPWP